MRNRAAACTTACAFLALSVAAPAAQAPHISKPSVRERGAHRVVLVTSIDPRGSTATARLEFGPTPKLGTSTGIVKLGAGTQPVIVTMTLQQLQSQTTYYYRLFASNAGGRTTSPLYKVTTPKIGPRVLPSVRMAFAIATRRHGSTIGRILSATRPQGLPSGTRVTIRCSAHCKGGRSFRTSGAYSGNVRFRPAIAITRRSVIEIRASHGGYLGRVRRYVFRRSGAAIAAERVLNACLSKPPEATMVRCP